MRASNLFCAIACICICFSMTGFSLQPKNMIREDFNPTNCTSDDDCAHVCFPGKDESLHSRCDPNGTCICDCSSTNPGDIPSSYADACNIKQPDGHWRDVCDKYCTQVYLRPFRYCDDSGKLYCTCVCNKKK